MDLKHRLHFLEISSNISKGDRSLKRGNVFILLLLLLMGGSGCSTKALKGMTLGPANQPRERTAISELDTVGFSNEVIDWCQQNIINFETLSPNQKHTIYYGISNFYNYFKDFDSREEFFAHYLPKKKLPIFMHKGIVVVILLDNQKLTDILQLAHLKGKKVKDVFFGYGDDSSGNRLMDDLEGEGSHRLIVIKKKAVRDSIHGEMNKFYHELGHLIHQSGFSKSQAYKIEDLYLNAKKLNLFLDDYAAVNEQEYFAVGIEAYLSETKKDKSWQYYKHEKRDLVEKDPDLFHFIEEAISYGKQ